MFTSEAVTRGVRVRVESKYSPERSDPFRNHWFFLYTITIANEGSETVQLLTRHWVITDGTGHVEEVRGPGVVGKQPILKQGESTWENRQEVESALELQEELANELERLREQAQDAKSRLGLCIERR